MYFEQRGDLMTTTAEKPIEKLEDAKAVDKRKALGRGLDSLLPGGPRVVAPPVAPRSAASPTPEQTASPRDAVLEIPLDSIQKNPYQTRTAIDENSSSPAMTALRELADSIKANGVIQPITVRQVQDGQYLLITGERRWKASRMAGKTTIPAIVRQVSDQQAAEMTVIENLQRQDLNCVDQARAFLMLSQRFRLTQEQIGLRVGVSRESVANYMRLTRLPPEIQRFLEQGRLSFSHARLLLNLVDSHQLNRAAELAVQRGMSVQELEKVVEAMTRLIDTLPEQPIERIDPNVKAAQEQLQRILGVRVNIRDRKGSGKIVIEYKTLEDFDRVLEMLTGKE
jgi:ParB family chromosome partitioning protein